MFKIKLSSIVVLIISFILLLYVTIDVCIVKPKFNERINNVTTEFDSLKVYLDSKLPELDSIVLIHSKQISAQNP